MANTTIQGGHSEYGSLATYTCVKGHRFPDKSKRIDIFCNQWGEWSETVHPCNGMYEFWQIVTLSLTIII